MIKTYNILEDKVNMEAAMKQQPMPVKVVVVGTRNYKHQTILGIFTPAIFDIDREYQCPMCGKVLRKESRFGIRRGAKFNYCPHCGQKLWWR